MDCMSQIRAGGAVADVTVVAVAAAAAPNSDPSIPLLQRVSSYVLVN